MKNTNPICEEKRKPDVQAATMSMWWLAFQMPKKLPSYSQIASKRDTEMHDSLLKQQSNLLF